MPLRLFATLVHPEVISHVYYCNSLFLRLPKAQLGRLQTLLDRCVKIVYHLPRDAPSEEVSAKMRNDFHLLPMGPRIDCKILLFVYKASMNDEPGYLCDMLNMHRNGKLFHPYGHSYGI